MLDKEWKLILRRAQIGRALTADDWKRVLLPWLLRSGGKLGQILHKLSPECRPSREEMLEEARRRFEIILGDVQLEQFEEVFTSIVRNECVRIQSPEVPHGPELLALLREEGIQTDELKAFLEKSEKDKKKIIVAITRALGFFLDLERAEPGVR